MRVAVAGSTGAVGVPLVRRLREAGHEVIELSRRAGVDVLEPASLERALAGRPPEVVVQQLTALPADPVNGDMLGGQVQTRRLRTEGMGNLVAAAPQARFVSQSIAFAYRPKDRLHTEQDPLWTDGPAAGSAEAILEMERITLAAGGVVLRYGWFYGPGTWFAADGATTGELRRRRLPVIGRGRGVWSWCHVEDAAAAVLPALERGSGIYNVCDDDPAPAREWLPALARSIGAPKPWRVPRFVARRMAGDYAVAQFDEIQGASNERFKSDLGWTPLHPTWRGVLGKEPL